MKPFSSLIGTECILIYPSRSAAGPPPSKEVLLSALSALIARDWPVTDEQEITALVLKREATLSTQLSPHLAVPHAIIPGAEESRIAVAVLHEGVDWESDGGGAVRLVVMLVGGEADHLKRLSELAGLLKDERLLSELVEADTPDQFIALLKEHEESLPRPLYYGQNDLSAKVFAEALRLKESVAAARLILHADAVGDGRYIGELIKERDVLVVSGGGASFDQEFIERHRPVIIPIRGVRRSAHVQFTLLYLLGKGVIGEDDLIVNVYGRPGSGFLDSIRISHLKRELDLPFAPGKDSFPQDLDLAVFTRVLQLATELALEGREGKPVGTLFVVGDYEGVTPYTRQMIVNPFYGYQKSERNILDPGMEETIKEYARIDGAFIIGGDGTIESAGTFLSGQPTAAEMQSGLGARHAAAQGISAVSSCLAVAISESTRRVTVFQAGRRVMEL